MCQPFCLRSRSSLVRTQLYSPMGFRPRREVMVRCFACESNERFLPRPNECGVVFRVRSYGTGDCHPQLELERGAKIETAKPQRKEEERTNGRKNKSFQLVLYCWDGLLLLRILVTFRTEHKLAPQVYQSLQHRPSAPLVE